MGAPGTIGTNIRLSLARPLVKEDEHLSEGTEIDVDTNPVIGPAPKEESMWKHLDWGKVIVVTGAGVIAIVIVLGTGGTATPVVAGGSRFIPALAGG